KTAIHAAMTGHLVLSTLHATDTISAMSRLAELGVDRSLAAGVILGVIAQRLVRLNCEYCAEPEHPRTVYLECLGIPSHEQSRFRHGIGCETCHYSGTHGRLGLYEVLDVRGAIREMCATGSEADLRRSAHEARISTRTQHALALEMNEIISVDDAYRSGNFGGD